MSEILAKFRGRWRPLLLLLLLLLLAPGCSRVAPEAVVEQFYASWGEQDYGSMYELLDSVSRDRYSEEAFTERYSGISEGIALEMVETGELEKKDSRAGELTFSLSAKLNTGTVGAIPLRYEIVLSREKRGAPWLLRWHPGLIFPELDDESRVQLDYENPGRGRLSDRHGALLAGPGKFKELGAVPGRYENEEEFAAAVETVLGLSSDGIIDKLHQPWVEEGLYVPLAVLTPAQEDLVDRLLQISGVMIDAVERRSYPAGPVAAHLTGYLGEITAAELEEMKAKGYREGDRLGKNGLEAALEQRLAGKRGYTLRICKDDGSEKALIAKKEVENGEDITLTVDLELQRCAAEALGKRKGAVLAMDPRSGEILALYSNPGFDPNLFIAGLSADRWQEMQADRAQPFLDRALSGIYPPGSAFKPFTAAAALDAQVLDPADRITIKGEQWQPAKSWGDYYIRRVHPEVTRLDLDEAMKFSDNIYFARAVLALGEERFTGYGERFGFGEQIPFTLPVARSRLVREKMGSEAQLADSGFGQGEVLVTPLQMALLYCAFAGEGSIPQPRLLLSEEAAPWKEEAVTPAVAETVHRSLVAAVHGAGAPSAAGAIPGMKVAGKTGTAEIDSGEGNICWYLTYGPADSPGAVVAVVIEEGGWAATEALPVGRTVLQRCLQREKDSD